MNLSERTQDKWNSYIIDFLPKLRKAVKNQKIDTITSEINEWLNLSEKVLDIYQDKLKEIWDRLAQIAEKALHYKAETEEEAIQNFACLSPTNGFERDILYYFWEVESKPKNTCSIYGFVIDDNTHEGKTGRLTLELFDKGTGDIYRNPIPHAFLVMDKKFQEAIESAKEVLKDHWPEDQDIRWKLEIDGETEHLGRLSGPSLGGAFVLALWKLLREDDDFDLEGVGISVKIDKKGIFYPITDLSEKLGEDFRKQVESKLLRFVLLSTTNKETPETPETPETLNFYLSKYIEDGVVFCVGNIKEAIEKIRENDRFRIKLRKAISEKFSCMDSVFRYYGNIAMSEYYQPLHIVHRISKQVLPKEKEDSLDGKYSQNSLPYWEEKIRQSYQYEEAIEMEKIIDEKPQSIVLGAPGSGKTTFLKNIAWKMANRNLSLSRLPVFVSLRIWEKKKYGSIDQYLESEYNICFQECKKWIEKGEIFFFFDGLDEVSRVFYDDVFNQEYQRIKKSCCSTIISCRTITFDSYSNLGDEMPVLYIAGLSEQSIEEYIRKFPKKSLEYNPEILIEELNDSSDMKDMVSNPLLLSILCFLVDDPKAQFSLPATRVEFYKKAITKFFIRPEKSIQYPEHQEPDIQKKVRILATIAFDSFLGNGFIEGIEDKHFDNAIKTNSAAIALRKECLVNGLLVSDNINGMSFFHKTFHEFLVAKFLADIVNDNQGQKWDTLVKINGQEYSVRMIVDKKAWDPDWQEIILLFAGQLDDPMPFLEMLYRPEPTITNPKGDDILRHRLCLAALCLPEIPSAKIQGQDLVTDITTDAFNFWWDENGLGSILPDITTVENTDFYFDEYYSDGTVVNLKGLIQRPHIIQGLTRANGTVWVKKMPASKLINFKKLLFTEFLEKVIPKFEIENFKKLPLIEFIEEKIPGFEIKNIKKLTLLEWIKNALENAALENATGYSIFPSLSLVLPHILECILEKISSDLILRPLVDLCSFDKGKKMRFQSLLFIERNAKKKYVVEKIVSLLANKSFGCYSLLANGLVGMGVSKDEGIIKAILSLLKNDFSRIFILDALNAYGYAVAKNKEIIDALIGLLEERVFDLDISIGALGALLKIGGKEALIEWGEKNDIAQYFIRLLTHKDTMVRKKALVVLDEMEGLMPKNRDVYRILIFLLEDENLFIVVMAIRILLRRRHGTISENEPEIKWLIGLLLDDDYEVSHIALDMLCEMGDIVFKNKDIIQFCISLFENGKLFPGYHFMYMLSKMIPIQNFIDLTGARTKLIDPNIVTILADMIMSNEATETEKIQIRECLISVFSLSRPYYRVLNTILHLLQQGELWRKLVDDRLLQSIISLLEDKSSITCPISALTLSKIPDALQNKKVVQAIISSSKGDKNVLINLSHSGLRIWRSPEGEMTFDWVKDIANFDVDVSSKKEIDQTFSHHDFGQ